MSALTECVKQRERQYTFFLFMLNKTVNQIQANNSSLDFASVHETDRMSSLVIAEITGKQHYNVIRDIRNLLGQGVSQLNFELSSYKQPQPKGGYKEVPCYQLTKKGCLILASGYDAKLRERIIDRWEELETKERNGDCQVPHTFKEALLLAVQQQEQIEEQQRMLEMKDEAIAAQTTELRKAAPKVTYYDEHLQSVNTLTTTQIAKEIALDANKLNRKLRDCGVLYSQSGQWLLKSPYSTWNLHAVRTQVFTRSDNSRCTNTYTVWTQKGRRFIIALYENDWNVREAIRQIKGETEKGKASAV